MDTSGRCATIACTSDVRERGDQDREAHERDDHPGLGGEKGQDDGVGDHGDGEPDQQVRGIHAELADELRHPTNGRDFGGGDPARRPDSSW